MPKAVLPQGSLPLLILKILARSGPLHGYGITLRIEHLSQELLSPEEGSLYPALHRLEEAGSIHARWVTTEQKRRARMYEITDAGRTLLEAEEKRWRTATAAVSRVLRLA